MNVSKSWCKWANHCELPIPYVTGEIILQSTQGATSKVCVRKFHSQVEQHFREKMYGAFPPNVQIHVQPKGNYELITV
jgi:hypothetical protein